MIKKEPEISQNIVNDIEETVQQKNGNKFSLKSVVMSKKSSVRLSKIKNLLHKNSVMKKHKVKKIRKIQPMWCYILSVFFALLMGTENLYLFMWQIKIPWVYATSMCLRIIFFIIVGIWQSSDWKYFIKLSFVLDRILATGIALSVSVYALSVFMIPFANYPWLYQALLYIYLPFVFTSMAYNRTIMVFCRWKPWQTILYKIVLVLSASSYIAVAMFFIFDPNMSLNFIHADLADSFIAIVILYGYAGFDYHIQTLSQLDEVDGTTVFRGAYELKSSDQDMEVFLFGNKINPKFLRDQMVINNQIIQQEKK